MRLLLIATLLFLAASVAAQDDDPETNCTEADPCPWVFDVDEQGFDDGTLEGPAFNGTVGDWIRFEVFNFDDAAHEISFDGQVWPVESFEERVTEPFMLDNAGSFAIRDEPSGDEIAVQVFHNDAAAVEDGEEAPITDAPETSDPTQAVDDASAALVLVLCAVALVVLRRR